MKISKKFLGLGVVIGITLCFSGCLSTDNFTYSTSLGKYTEDRLFTVETFYGTSLDDTRLVNPKNYEVLGPIIIRAKEKEGVVAYSEILAAAIAKYPQTTAVINIVRDSKKQQEGEESKIDTAWSGVAIKVTDTIVEKITTTSTKTANGDVVVTETKSYEKL